jgi:hypothetical protein
MPNKFSGFAVALGFMTASNVASAVPPFSNIVNRHLANNASAEHCQFSIEGFVCRSVSAGETDNLSDNTGFGFVAVAESGEDFSAGTQFSRTIGCFVGLDVFDGSKFGANFQATLNPNSQDCSTSGSQCDTGTGECRDFAYGDPVPASGNWLRPIQSFSSRINRVDSNAATGFTTHAICQDHGGSLMREGGFEIDGNEVSFDGRTEVFGDDDFLFGEFVTQKCLNKL